MNSFNSPTPSTYKIVTMYIPSREFTREWSGWSRVMIFWIYFLADRRRPGCSLSGRTSVVVQSPLSSSCLLHVSGPYLHWGHALKHILDSPPQIIHRTSLQTLIQYFQTECVTCNTTTVAFILFTLRWNTAVIYRLLFQEYFSSLKEPLTNHTVTQTWLMPEAVH